jgi:hypothetical protein
MKLSGSGSNANTRPAWPTLRDSSKVIYPNVRSNIEGGHTFPDVRAQKNRTSNESFLLQIQQNVDTSPRFQGEVEAEQLCSGKFSMPITVKNPLCHA